MVRKMRVTAPRAAKAVHHEASPIVQSILSQIAPNRCMAGVGGLLMPKESQKLRVVSRAQATLNAGDILVGFINPAVPNDTTGAEQWPSLMCYYGTAANMGLASSTFTSTTVGIAPASINILPVIQQTPYALGAINDQDMECRCHGGSLNLAYTGADLYRSGLVKYFDDTGSDFMTLAEMATLTAGLINSRLDSDQRAIRHQMAKSPRVELPIAGTERRDVGSTSGGGWERFVWNLYNDGSSPVLGGTTSPYRMQKPAGYFSYTNQSTVTVYLDIELVTFWEFRGREIAATHTPSVGHAIVHSAVVGLTEAAKAHHAKTQSSTFGTAIKAVSKLAHHKQAMSGIEPIMTAALALL
jgi:hypothetical protein